MLRLEAACACGLEIKEPLSFMRVMNKATSEILAPRCSHDPYKLVTGTAGLSSKCGSELFSEIFLKMFLFYFPNLLRREL